MLHTLDEIRAAGARAVIGFPPLTPQQLDTVAALIHPIVAVPAPAATRTHIPKATPQRLAA